MKIILSTAPGRKWLAALLPFYPYILPLILATVLLLFSIAFSFPCFPGATDVYGKQPGTQTHQTKNETLDAFLKKLEQQHAVAVPSEAGYVTVRLSNNTRYRLYQATTYQEVATLDSGLLHQISRQLDAQGIEYEVFKNNSDTVLIHAGEWIINWGGLLYIPDISAF